MLSLKSPYASVKKDCSNFFSAAGFIGISPNVQSSLCRAAESISAINSEMQPIFSRSVFAEMPTNCVNLNTGAITQVAETGISALAGQNFYNQSGCLFENTFYWAAIPGASANAKTLVRFDVTNGAFEELGKIADGTNGLQTTGMFAIPMGNASIAADKLNNVSIAD